MSPRDRFISLGDKATETEGMGGGGGIEQHRMNESRWQEEEVAGSEYGAT